jgi:hypothetical protein
MKYLTFVFLIALIGCSSPPEANCPNCTVKRYTSQPDGTVDEYVYTHEDVCDPEDQFDFEAMNNITNEFQTPNGWVTEWFRVVCK